MAQMKFITVKGATTLTDTPFYVGLVQHERTRPKHETYDYLVKGRNFLLVNAVELAPFKTVLAAVSFREAL